MKILAFLVHDRIAGLRSRLAKSGYWLRELPRFSVPAIAQVMPEVVEFQDGVDEIVREPIPRFIDSTHYLIMLLFLILILIASVVEVDVVLGGAGRLITTTPTIVVQPLDRGIIRDLKIKPGVSVTKGQVLATLDPTFTQADMASLTAQQDSLQAQERRIEAELNNTPFTLSATPNREEQLQATLFQQRQAEYKARLNVFDEDILRLQATVHTAKSDRVLLEKQLALARDVEDLRGALSKSQSGSKLQLLDAQSSRMHVERDYQDVTNRLLEVEHSIESKLSERRAFIDDWRRQLLENSVTLRTTLSNAMSGLVKASRMRDLVVLTAPEDGVVLDVAKLSVGSVLRDAETLATIVPANATLEAEIAISSEDIGYVKVGDQVTIKMDAFPYSRHGYMTGELISISAESFAIDPSGAGSQPSSMSRSNGGVFYRGWITLSGTKLEHMPKTARLLPGMTLSAEIKVGTRSIMFFLLSPVMSGLSDSFREP